MERLPGEAEVDEGLESGGEEATGLLSDDVGSEPSGETEGAATEQSEEPSGKESVKETVARAYRDLQEGKVTEVDNNPAKVDKAAAQKPTQKDAKKGEEEVDPAKELEIDPSLIAPERLNAVEKQMFNNLPKGLKKAFSRTIKNLESTTTKANQELAQTYQSVSALKEVVGLYVDDWADRGMTPTVAIAKLASAQRKLENPATTVPTLLEIGNSLGVDWEQIAAIARGDEEYAGTQKGGVADIENHPKFKALQETVKSLTSNVEQSRLAPVIERAAEEMRAVQHETDPATGEFKYPELHDEEYLESLKPLVSVLRRTVPNLSHGEALRRAHLTRQGNIGTSTQQQARLPAASNNVQQRAVAAAVTVRGKTAPVSSQQGQRSGGMVEPPPGVLDNPKATTKWILEQLQQGNDI